MKPNIHKIQAVTDFTILHNLTARDKRLSYRARGILIMMLTLPPDWKTHASWIEEQGTEGREALRSCFRELERFGYLTRRKIRDSRKFAGMEWEWRHTPQKTALSEDGKPSDEKPAATKNRVNKEKRVQKKEGKGVLVPKTTTFSSGSSFDYSQNPYPTTEEDLETLLTENNVEYTPDYDGSFWEEFHGRGWKMPNGDRVADVVKLYQSRIDTCAPKPRFRPKRQTLYAGGPF